ncbi:unnamed protein product [Paramecium pentaurelia]|uniref:Uncharacterized protein n=1 Tax=Paramecium pentaurelia TaxID=43138 RepID=A0A8S1URR4_9CILI|nr:unnamed protein product [Paramecium pentaurelia]
MRNLLVFGILDHVLYMSFVGSSDYSIALICLSAGILSTRLLKENNLIFSIINVSTIIIMVLNAMLLQSPIMYVAVGCSIIMAMKSWWTCFISAIGIIVISLKIDIITICEILAFLSTSAAYLLYNHYKNKSKIKETSKSEIVSMITKRDSIQYKQNVLEIGQQSPNKEFEQTEYNLFKKLLTAFPDGVLILDEQYNIQFSNSAFRSLMNETFVDVAKQKLLTLRNAINSEQDNYQQLFLILYKKLKSRSKSLGNEKSDYIQLKSSVDQEEEDQNNQDNEQHYNNLSQSPIIIDEVKQIFKQMLEREPKQDLNSFTLKFFQDISIICQGEMQKIFQVILKPYIAYSKGFILFIIRDITHVNQIAALEKTNFNKSQMLYKIAHEFKTPLNIIIQSVGNVLNPNHNANEQCIKQLEKSMQPIKSMASSLLSLVNDLLDVAQLKAGKFNLQFQQVKITELINEIIEIMKIQANSKGLYMKLEQQKHVPQQITTDPNRVKQIILNLLSNAIKFTEIGGITINLDSDEDCVEIKVKDTGIGIPKNEQNKLFTAFGRLENSDNITGVGLGLMISNILAQKLGQEIKVYSDGENQGSTFSFKILNKREIDDSVCILYDDDNEGIVNQLRNIPQMCKYNEMVQSPSNISMCQCVQILIVDDMPFNISIIENQLKQYDIIIDKAYSVKEAIAKIDAYNGCNLHSTYQYILMDIEMPIINGYQAVSMIRERVDTRIIACSAHSKNEISQLSLFDGYLQKPINVNQIFQLLKHN